MNYADRAIILAAGVGKRLRPLTWKTPKPLIKVNGVMMIDTIIQGLHKNGIHNIYIVVGYKQEAFDCLLKNYEGIHFIENPYYDVCNNISSLYVAREYISNSIILDGDQLIFNEKILSPAFERSGYNAVWTDKSTHEWLMTVENGIVTHCSRIGGKRGWQLYSVSRWKEEDGQKLCRHLEIEFEEKKNRAIYWDDVPLFCYPDEYELEIKPIRSDDIAEIDNLYELAELDSAYLKYIPGE